MYASAIIGHDLDLWPLKTFSAVATYVVNIGIGKQNLFCALE